MRIFSKIVRLLISITLGLLIIFPFYWLLISSFKPGSQILIPNLWPSDWTLLHYYELLTQTFYLTALRSSTVIAISSMIINLIIVIMASYAIYRLKLYGRNFLQKLLLITYIFPGILLIVPIYNMMSNLHLIDTQLSLVIINVTFVAPFSVWLLKGFYESIPTALDESAALDGAGKMGILFTIILPLMKGGIVAIAIYSLIMSWTEYTFSSILISTENIKTLPMALHAILGQFTVRWGHTIAGGVLTILPILILFGMFGKYFVSGLIEGAIKG